MKYLKYITFFLFIGLLVSCGKDSNDPTPDPAPGPNPNPGPAPKPDPTAPVLPVGELRGVWVTTAWGIDWPMGDYNATSQQKRYTDYLDLFVKYGINAIFFQVRSMADAFYDSPYEPWSQNITGTSGKAPSYDILKFLIEEAHKRDIQFHAWINPYRIATRAVGGTFPALSSKIPAELTKDYQAIRIYNPALPEVQQRIQDIVKDLITKYPVDGVHMDDYFYPTLQTGESMNDEVEFNTYGGNFRDVASFRRNNVDVVIKGIQQTIINTRPEVIFSVSPAGNYNGNYNTLYADCAKWMNGRWVDVMIPQLYVSTTSTFKTYLDWFVANSYQTPLMVGYGIYKFGDPAQYGSIYATTTDLLNQFAYADGKKKVIGSLLYSANSLTANKINVMTTIADRYKSPVLLPYLGRTAAESFDAPSGVKLSGSTLSWNSIAKAVRYAVYLSNGGGKEAKLVGVTTTTSLDLPGKGTYFVTGVDKVNAQSKLSELITY
ncbi:MAG: family 10 glycosylhydrolase [Prevotellaceae bacterium]|jgi:uncharacterized lipoprotein YddW (UPF0748 family)|nr:family 10 glycosylhydrolase [Prevotellaceae bacterium]